MKKIEEMTEQEFKKEFIKWFDEEKWNQIEILGRLEHVVEYICDTWMKVEPIPILFGENMGEASSFLDFKNLVIWLNPSIQNEYVRLLDATLHELEHYYQIIYALNFTSPKAKRWKNELTNYIGLENPVEYALQEIEIDACAFSQVVLATEFGIMHKFPNPDIQNLIEEYIKSKKIIEEN